MSDKAEPFHLIQIFPLLQLAPVTFRPGLPHCRSTDKLILNEKPLKILKFNVYTPLLLRYKPPKMDEVIHPANSHQSRKLSFSGQTGFGNFYGFQKLEIL